MLQHYLLTAMRAFARHKLYTFLNVAGFTVGLACAILIALYAYDELSYDKWIADTDNLYRLEGVFALPGRDPMRSAQVPFPVVKAMQEHIPGVQAVTHVVLEQMTVDINGRQFRENITVVDPNLFQVIKLPLVEGDPAHVLEQSTAVVLSQSSAHKFFGDANPVGKILSVIPEHGGTCAANDTACLSQPYPLTVTGVLRDLPYNTQLVADIVVPNTSRVDKLSLQAKQHWGSLNGDYGYVKLAPGVTPAAVLSGLGPLLDRSFDPKAFGINMRASELEKYHLTPFADAHLTSDQYGGMRPAGSWTTVYGLIAIATLIVLIACFNFMNLATARATLRAREVALRKLGGATRTDLHIQFLGEAVLMALISLLAALAIAEVLLPIYGRMLDKPIQFHYLTDWKLLAGLIALAIAVGLLSGLYPAWVLAAFRPAAALKVGVATRSGPGVLRSVLVVAQFAISIGLGITALVVFRQIDFARQVDLGFRRDGVVVVRGISELTASARDHLAQELQANPQILDVAYSNGVPFDLNNTSNPFIGLQGETPSISARSINADPAFPGLYDMRLVAGRLLSKQRGEDISTKTHNVLINLTAARRLGLKPEDAIGKILTIGNLGAGQVVGVVNDANFSGARQLIEPTVLYFDSGDPSGTTKLSIRLKGDRLEDTLAFIDARWRALVPGVAMDRYFLTDDFDRLFQSDVRQGEMLGVFVVIAVFIACLGLFGLAVFTAQRRTKEIGIRKISGARTVDILQRLLWQISIPVLIANLISWPFAYVYLTHWLETYAYRITLNPLYFLTAAAVALVIAWTTVLAHAVQLARASPIHALRYE